MTSPSSLHSWDDPLFTYRIVNGPGYYVMRRWRGPKRFRNEFEARMFAAGLDLKYLGYGEIRTYSVSMREFVRKEPK